MKSQTIKRSAIGLAKAWGSVAGSIKSPAKAAASRRNGKLGGRPRTIKPSTPAK
jgi:hypothetical protein